MFELGLTGEVRRSIRVETRRGRPLENYVAPSVSQADINFYYGALRRNFPRWELRKHAIGVYNCAGMVWADRRTALVSPVEWQQILTDDEYRQIPLQTAEIDDIVVYRSQSDAEILHVARVCIKVPLAGSQQFVFKALSKWDQSKGEDIHLLKDVLLNAGEPFDLEIWTDRTEPDERIRFVSQLPLLPT